MVIWDKVFKSGLSKFCGRQPLKSFSGYGLLQHYFVPFDLLFFGNAKKSLTTKTLYKPFYSDWKETTYKRSSEAVPKKNFFSSAHTIWYSVLRWMFFIPCYNWNILLFIKFYCCSEFFQPPSPGPLLNVLCTFDLRPLSTGMLSFSLKRVSRKQSIFTVTSTVTVQC